MIKPPKYGNCTVSETPEPQICISLNDLKALNGQKSITNMAKYREELKRKLDVILEHEEWEADDVIEYNSEPNSLSSTIDCIVYYVTGFSF